MCLTYLVTHTLRTVAKGAHRGLAPPSPACACRPVPCSHVVGPIAARGNNAAGIVGVCQSGLKQISLKFLGGPYPGNGTTAAAIAALDYVLALKDKYNLSLVATSNSWWVAHTCYLPRR